MPTSFERGLLIVCTVCWAVALIHFSGLMSLAGPLPMSLYGFYSAAGALGWVSGNVYIRRRGRVPRPLRTRMRLLYWLGPPGLLYLLRAWAPAADQLAAPLVPHYALLPYTALFLVPVALARFPGGDPEERERERRERQRRWGGR